MKRLLSIALPMVLWAGGVGDARALEVALIGDNARQAAFQQLAREFNAPVAQAASVQRASTADRKIVFTVAKAGRDPVAVANQLLTADLALLVVDATQGPLPIVREHVIVARQAHVPLLAIYFAQTKELLSTAPEDAAELLELEEMEMRELVGVYTMGGDSLSVFFDSPVGQVYRSKSGEGTPALRRLLASGLPSRPAPGNLQQVSEFAGAFYLLTEPEGRERNRAISVVNGTQLDVWMAGSLRPAVVRTKGTHAPGDSPDFTLKLPTPATATEGMRLLLLRNGMVVGVGVVAQIVH